MDEKIDLIIAGGGLAGCIAALALAERRPEIRLLLLEREGRFGGNHVWSFFDTDVAAEDRALVAPLVSQHWRAHEIRFPRRSRQLAIGYNSIRSDQLDQVVRDRLRPGQYRLNAEIVELGETQVRLGDGSVLEAAGVIDARGAGRLEGLELGWQKFVGRHYRFDRPHGRHLPIIMDALVDQSDGYRFAYTLPFSQTELLVEDTYYSTSPTLDAPLLRGRLDAYRGVQGWPEAGPIGEEQGVLPVALGGDVMSLWPEAEPPVARLGLRGGFFHPTTGYSLPDAVRNAALLARQPDFGTAALHGLLKARAAALWKERGYYRLLNRMLFHATAPQERYRVLEHFYRLPEPLIGRFYAGETKLADKLRILIGRPPVPVGRAFAAARGRRA